MAGLAYQFAMASDQVTAEVYDIAEFQDVSKKYNVISVPKTVINDKVEILGAVSERQLLLKIMEAVGG